MRVAVGLVLGVLLAGFGAPAAASAQDQSALLEMLAHADSFRVRARAALALARTGDEHAISGLESALSDFHPAVRAAAALALGQIGTRRSVPALREATSDPSPVVVEEAKSALRAIAAREVIKRAVPTGDGARGHDRERAQPAALGKMRYAVVLGEMRNRSAMQDASFAAELAARISEGLRKLDRVVVFSAEEMTEGVAQELAHHKLPVFRLEGNLNRFTTVSDAGAQRMRCEVSLLLLDEPERTLRGMMKGAATSSEQARGALDPRIAHQTIASAVKGALTNAVQALEAALAHGEPAANDSRAQASIRGEHKRSR